MKDFETAFPELCERSDRKNTLGQTEGDQDDAG